MIKAVLYQIEASVVSKQCNVVSVATSQDFMVVHGVLSSKPQFLDIHMIKQESQFSGGKSELLAFVHTKEKPESVTVQAQKLES